MVTAIATDSAPAVVLASEAAALKRLWLLGVAIVVSTGLAAYTIQVAGDNAFILIALTSGFLAMAATRVAEGAPTRKMLWWIIAVAILLRGILLFLDPLLSNDIYRYIWDGKVQAAGTNPYRYFPVDQALAQLRDAAIYPNINRPDYATTIYPPVAQMFFFLVTRLGETVTTMKLGLVACEGVTVAIIIAFLRRLGRPETRVVAYAWHPLPIWEIANNGHVDALMVMLMMLGLWLGLTGRPLRGAAAIALAALAKPFALLSLAAIWRPWDWRVPVAVIAIIAACYLPYLSVGWGVFGFLTSGYLQEEHISTGGAFWIVSAWRSLFDAMQGDTIVFAAGSALLITALAMFAAHREPHSMSASLTDLNWLLLVFFLLLSPNYPWYFLMITPFVALRGGAPNWALSLGAILMQDEVQWDYSPPVLIRKTILYGTFFGTCVYVTWRASHDRRSAGELQHERVDVR